ncbi:MAG TPA: hypothetical protein VFK11_03520, partial [Candidatus Saccharimonadales bacterium]|nr:hypothetical protein [Candidatus Saccharimonadales bacterium]
FKLSNIFIAVVLVGILGQILAIIVPAVGGAKERIHDFGAYTMAFMLIPASLLVALGHVPLGVKILAFLCTSYMLVSMTLFFAIPSLSSRYLYFQAAYILVFHTVILASTYLA